MNANDYRKRLFWNHFIARWAVEGDEDAINMTQLKLRGLLGVIFKPEYDYAWKEILALVSERYTPEALEVASKATYLMTKGRFWIMMHGVALQAGIARPRSTKRTGER